MFDALGGRPTVMRRWTPSGFLPLIARVLLRFAGVVVIYLALQAQVRYLEALACVALLRAVNLSQAHAVAPDSIQAFPPGHTGFVVNITPSCSCLAPILSVGLLATLLPVKSRSKLCRAILLGVTAIAVGNILRIALSVMVGYVSSSAALILFHDWVGSVFSFLYTLFGFVLLIRSVLHGDTDPSTAVPA
jgi:carbamoyl-phosphate synthase large subunit